MGNIFNKLTVNSLQDAATDPLLLLSLVIMAISLASILFSALVVVKVNLKVNRFGDSLFKSQPLPIATMISGLFSFLVSGAFFMSSI